MPANIIVVGPKDCPAMHSDFPNFVNTTSRSSDFGRSFSPFFLGPVSLYPGAPCDQSKNVENAWQYAKVYSEYLDDQGNPTDEYFQWALKGFQSSYGVRYPKGKGRAPEYSWWGEKLGYIDARKKIYIPLFSSTIVKTKAWEQLKELYNSQETLILWDFDGYNHKRLDMSYKDVVNCPTKTMGHAFVIAMMLEDAIEEALEK